MSAGGIKTGRGGVRGPAFRVDSLVAGVCCSTVLTSWAMTALLPLGSSSADFDLLRPIRFQPLQFDFQDAVVEARLNLVGIDTERKLDRARESAVRTLAALPIAVLLLRLRFALAREREHILLEAEIDVIAGNTGQFGRYNDPV